jgi:hypothetical protein
VFSCHFFFHEQVNGTVHVSVPVSIVSLHFEALQGVHRAREERKGIGRDFSTRNPVDLSYRNPLDARSVREIEV